MNYRKTGIAVAMMAATTVTHAAPNNEELWQMMQKMQQEIEQMQQQKQQLISENAALKNQLMETEQAVEAVAVAAEEAVNRPLLGGDTHIGGYGELHFNNLDGSNGAASKDQIDFHRFVLFFGHEFTDDLRFFSELELEHSLAGEGKEGEVELEQAYVEYDINQHHRVKGGLFLMPVGILNETHEPETFYGVERNNVEKNIIPTTWWEGGVMFSGELGQGFSYDVAMTSGLETSADNSYKIRNGRNKVAEASANDFAYIGRLKWTGIPGVEIGATAQYQEDLTQGTSGEDVSATFYEVHTDIQKGPLGLRALYATWDLDGEGPKAIGADEQTGWYIEPSFKINQYVGVFGSYSQWDNEAGSDSQSEYEQWNVGVNWWPHKQVVIKADYQDQEKDNGEQLKGLNLGIGYSF